MQDDIHRRRVPRVLDDIREGLLKDPEQRRLRLRAQGLRAAGPGQPDIQAGAAGLVHQGLERAEVGLRGPVAGVIGPQDTEEAAHPGKGLTAGRRGLEHLPAGAFRIGRRGRRRGLGEGYDDHQTVGDDVVHLPRDPGAFGRRGELRLLGALLFQALRTVLDGGEVAALGPHGGAEEERRGGQPAEDDEGVVDARGRSEPYGHQDDPELDGRGGGERVPQAAVGGDGVERDEHRELGERDRAERPHRHGHGPAAPEDDDRCPAAQYQGTDHRERQHPVQCSGPVVEQLVRRGDSAQDGRPEQQYE